MGGILGKLGTWGSQNMGGPHLGELNASAQGGGGGSRPVLKFGVAQQAGDEFVAKQTFISLFRNGMNAFFISL